jgi:hypothetical protein
MRNIGAGKSTMKRARLIANLLVKMPRLNRTAESHCEVAQSLADDLGCSVRVREALGYSFERWDGKGFPRKKRADAIPLPMRLVQVADDMQACVSLEGLDNWFEVFRTLQAAEIWATLGEWITQTKPQLGPGVKERIAYAATIPRDRARRRRRDAIDGAAGVGAFADLKVVATRAGIRRASRAGGGRGRAARQGPGSVTQRCGAAGSRTGGRACRRASGRRRGR